MTRRYQTYWAPLLAVICWSGNFVVTKLSAGTIEPGVIGFYRCCVAVLVMTPFLLPSLMQSKRQVIENLPKLAVLGLFGTAMYQGLAYFAAQATTATNMGIITSFVPLVTIGMSSILLQERPRLAAGVGGVISLLGLLFLVAQGNFEAMFVQGVNYGDGLMFMASISYSLYCVLLSRWVLPLSIWESLYLQSICAAIEFLPIYLLAPSSTITSQNIPLILYAGIVASVIAPFLWMRGVASLGPSRTSTFMNLFPLMTALIAIGILKEKIQFYHLIGGLMTLMGVVIAQKESTSLHKKINFRRKYAESQ